MTQFDDPLKQGRAYFAKAIVWGTNNQYAPQYPSADQSVNAMEARGVPHSQTITYEVGAASTPLASGSFFSTATIAGGTLTCTGVLAGSSSNGGTTVFDVARSVQVTASVNLATNLFTIRGTDGYGQSLTCTFIGPSGDTLGATGSFVLSPSTFKTFTTASFVGSSTGGLQVGSGPQLGLPFRIANAGKGLGVNVNGVQVNSSTASTQPIFTAGFAATGTHTASGADVRGTFYLPTTSLPNGAKFFTVQFVAPNLGVTESSDTKENSYGLTPFTN